MQSGQRWHSVPKGRDVEGRIDEGALGRRRLGLLLGGLALQGLPPRWAHAGGLGFVPGAFRPGWFSSRRTHICAGIVIR